MIRQLPESDYLRTKALFKRLVKIVGGLDAAAGLTRPGKTMLCEYGNPDNMECFAPADVLMDLQCAAEKALISRDMTRLVGETCTPKEPMEDGEIIALGARVAQQVGAYMETALDAWRDGRLTAAELEDAIAKAQDMLLAAQKAHDELCNLKAAREGSAQIDRVRAAAS